MRLGLHLVTVGLVGLVSNLSIAACASRNNGVQAAIAKKPGNAKDDRANLAQACYLNRLLAADAAARSTLAHDRSQLLTALGVVGCRAPDWIAQQRSRLQEEDRYCALSLFYGHCGDSGRAIATTQQRIEAFPHSWAAWHELAVRRFAPLWSEEGDVTEGDRMPAHERLAVASGVLDALAEAERAGMPIGELHRWRALAYAQRAEARSVVQSPQTDAQRLERIEARLDVMAAWKEQDAVCKLAELPACGDAPGGGECCPAPPFSEDETEEDKRSKARLLAAIAAQNERDRASHPPGPVHAPDPDRKALASTKAAAARRRGRVVIGFCVGTDGRTSNVKVVQSFPNDAQVDEICINTVKQWRFTPPRGERASTPCSTVHFDLSFQ